MLSVDDAEIVFVDDGSTDGSFDVFKMFWSERNAQCAHGIMLTRNSGLLHARMIGAVGAAGEYVVALDADDLLDVDVLPAIKRAIITTKKTAPEVVHFGILISTPG